MRDDQILPGPWTTAPSIRVEANRLSRDLATEFISNNNSVVAAPERFASGQTIEVPLYNHSRHEREKETRHVGQHTIIVLEGILLFVDPILRDLMDIRIFMDTPLDICLIRRLSRDIIERERTLESVLEQYQNTVRPMYLQFIEPSKRYADIIVPRGGENRIAIDLIKAKMKELLNGVSQ